MPDTLNQAAKQLRKNRERTDYNATRYARNFPLIERIRDSFEASNAFEMELIALPNQKIRITFHFYEPVPCGSEGG